MKKIKWGNKELPGLSFEELEKWDTRRLVARQKALNMSADPEILEKRGKAISKANKGRVNDMSYLNTKQAKDNWRKSIDLEALAERNREMAKKRRKSVNIYLDGKFYKTYESCLAASKELPISLASINNMLNGKTKECKGYTAKK